jgi:hypothetical protein
MSRRARRCTPTIHRFRCWRRATARPRPDDYVRDDCPAGDETPPAVWFAYSEDRKGEHPGQHLKDFTGALQADAYAGFHHLYGAGRIYEVACWAHARRKFYEIPCAPCFAHYKRSASQDRCAVCD